MNLVRTCLTWLRDRVYLLLCSAEKRRAIREVRVQFDGEFASALGGALVSIKQDIEADDSH
jgi:hypothetical protein